MRGFQESREGLELSRRVKVQQGLSSLFLPYYNWLGAFLDEKWQPYMGYRSIEEQDAIYAQGRTIPGAIVTHAKGPESAHCYGCAADWTIFHGEDPQWLSNDNPLWQEFDIAVEKAGLRSGALYADPGHIELKLSVSYHEDIARVYMEKGMDAAMARIAETMIK